MRKIKAAGEGSLFRLSENKYKRGIAYADQGQKLLFCMFTKINYMKLYVLLTFLFFTSVTYSQTMSDAQMKEAAAAMCNCIEPAIKKLHPQLLLMMKTAEEKNEKEAETELVKWMETASSENKTAFTESVTYMQSGFSDSLDVCQKKTQKYFPKNDIGNLSEKDLDRLIKTMETMPSCKYLLIFMKIGMKKEEEEAKQ